jgi:hypothetical protein
MYLLLFIYLELFHKISDRNAIKVLEIPRLKFTIAMRFKIFCVVRKNHINLTYNVDIINYR